MKNNENLEDKLEKIEELEHTADVKYLIKGDNLNEAFELCGYSYGMTLTNLLEIQQVEKIEFQIESEDLESLLYDFISELIFLFDTSNVIISNFTKVEVLEKNKRFSLTIEGIGEQFSQEKHELGTEIKAMTYAEMNIKLTNSDFSKPASIILVFDI